MVNITPMRIVLGILALFVLAAGLGGLVFGSYYVNTTNREVELRNLAGVKLLNCKAVHAKMHNDIREIGGVADAYMAGFDTMYTKIIGSRYKSNDGSLMKWIQESNPQFDNTLYTKLAVVIEARRAEFTLAQAAYLDVVREHKNLVRTIPAKWFVRNDTLTETVVTTTATEKAFATGVDDDIYRAGKQ